ncbi:Pol [Symbiodinium sp. CCMP2592]|nr:Pol [Symbiodinium sp. CCMP2592]
MDAPAASDDELMPCPKRRCSDEAQGERLFWSHVFDTECAGDLVATLAHSTVEWVRQFHADLLQGRAIALYGVSSSGKLVHLAMHVPTGSRIRLAVWGAMPLGAQAGLPEARLAAELCGAITADARLHVLALQGEWLADDQMAHGLLGIALSEGRCFRVLDPLDLSDSIRLGRPAGIIADLTQSWASGALLSALAIDGHWVTFCWTLSRHQVVAWTSVPMHVATGPLAEGIAAANWIVAKALGRCVAEFVCRGGPTRHVVPGMCGPMALLDLHHHVTQTFPNPEADRTIVAAFARAFQCEIGSSYWVRQLFNGSAEALSKLPSKGPTSLIDARAAFGEDPVSVAAGVFAQDGQPLSQITTADIDFALLDVENGLWGLVMGKHSPPKARARRSGYGLQRASLPLPVFEGLDNGGSLSAIGPRPCMEGFGPLRGHVRSGRPKDGMQCLSFVLGTSDTEPGPNPSQANNIIVGLLEDQGIMKGGLGHPEHIEVANDPWAAALSTKSVRAGPAVAPVVEIKKLEEKLQAQITAQITSQVAAANTTMATRVSALETSVAEVNTRVQGQESRLREAFQQLFEEQTARIEQLLAPKRPRVNDSSSFMVFRADPSLLGVYVQALEGSPGIRLVLLALLPLVAVRSLPYGDGALSGGCGFAASRSFSDQCLVIMSCLKGRACNASHLGLLALLASFRFGEASHPGPGPSRAPDEADDCFVLGAFNPTGLNGKHGIVSELPRGIHAVSESHLTARGLGLFRNGLHHAGNFFRYLPGPPAPCRARSAVTGDYTGVGFLSSVPCQVASFLVGAVWILGAVACGFPTSPSATASLLDAITDRVARQGSGPRFIAGDFNLQPHSLHHAQQWADSGFVEIQDLWHQQTGALPQVTCKNATRKDYLYISAELQPLLRSVTVDPTWFCDHSALFASFAVPGLNAPQPVWRMPRQRLLGAEVVKAFQESGDAHPPPPTDPEQAYRDVWKEFESRASQALRSCGQSALLPSECGRATTKEVHVVKAFQGQVAVGRQGEASPSFFGSDRQYCQWFRQLRRLQALAQSTRRATCSDSAALYRAGLWHAIQRAPGFKPSFSAWWPKREIQLPGDPNHLEATLPEPAVAQLIFLSFQANVKSLEKRLTTRRRAQAKQRRILSPALIFRDLQQSMAQPVDTIVQSVKATVLEVRAEEEALVFSASPLWRAGEGFFLNGQPFEVYAAQADAIWCDTEGVSVGDVVSQQKCIADLLGLFSAFGDEWLRRWMRHKTIEPGRWAAILEAFPESGWMAAVRSKHARSATGLDGVSRADLLALPGALTAQLLDLSRLELQLSIERAHIKGKPLVGALLDLSKAFNSLPRAPVFALALRLGLPRELVTAWSSAVAKLARRFQIRGATGPVLPSCSGFPEGCALSCVAMAIVDFALHLFVGKRADPEVLSTFVDDWQLIGHDRAIVGRALQAVEDFVSGWDPAMDPAKTIQWATHPAQRRELRRAGVAVALSCRNLGGYMVFTRQRSSSTLMQRIQSLDGLWPKLSASLAPLTQKVKALMQDAWPRALHGVSTVTLSDSTFASLRAGAARGLSLSRPGLNPKVLLSLVCHPLADPQFFAIASTFRDLRAYATPEALIPMIQQLLSTPGRWTQGPAQAFIDRCHSIGMSWDVECGCLRDSISSFDLWQTSPQEVGLRLMYAWQTRVGQELEARPGFQGLSRVDPGLTSSFKTGKAEHERLELLLVQSGAFFTQDALHHFSADPADSAACKYCGSRDSLHHRLWECSGFSECRDERKGWMLPDPATAMPCLALHGWALRRERQLQLWQNLHVIPDRVAAVDWPAILPETLDLFTDGSCLLPTLPQVRLAAWAVTLARDDGETPWVLCSGPLQGILQTAFRPKIKAVVAALGVALRARRAVRVWSDCAGVVRRVRAAKTGDLSPLWSEVVALVERIQTPWSIHKVAAHEDLSSSDSPFQDWLIANNAAVDRAAHRANMDRSSAFWQLWEAVRRDLALQMAHGRAMTELQVAVAERAIKGKDLVPAEDSHVPVGQLPIWGSDLTNLPRHLLKFGRDYVDTLVPWLRDVLHDTTNKAQWVSFAQLYLVFYICTGLAPPVYVDRARGWTTYSEDDPLTARFSMSDRARFFRQHVRAVVAATSGRLYTGEVRPFSAALAIKLPSCFVSIEATLLDRVESFLHDALPNGVCAQRGREWISIGLPRSA